MIARLSKFYNASPKLADAGPIWQDIAASRHSQLIEALESGDALKLASVLDEFGLSQGVSGIEGNDIFRFGDASCHEAFKQLARAIGVLPVFNPEQPSPTHNYCSDFNLPLLAKVEATIGIKLSVPDCFGYRFQGEDGGIPTRLPQYCAAAFCALRQIGIPRHVLEIGAGLGNLGFITSQWGTSSYTVIDLPQIAVLSAYFMSKVVGEDHVWLHGEQSARRFARFYPSTCFANAATLKYDLIFNSDSLPEMASEVQDGYMELISNCLSRDGIFLSVNHESDAAGQSRVYDAVKRNGKLSIRNRSPFWMRPGYVTEIYQLT